MSCLLERTESDDALDDDQRRLVIGVEKFCVGCIETDQVIGVGDGDHLPAQAFETPRDVFAECQFGSAFDRDFGCRRISSKDSRASDGQPTTRLRNRCLP